jgi:23S rRNA pseudouridine1911/1915/1917 synthase
MTLLSKNYKNDNYEVRLMVDENQDQMRLDQYLQEYLDSFSREAVKKKIKDKEVIIVGRPGIHKPSTVLHYKDEVVINFKKTHFEDEHWRGKKLELVLEPEIVL